MKFSVPVVYTVTGWVLVEASTLEEAKTKAAQMEDELCCMDINDPEPAFECLLDETEAINGETDDDEEKTKP